MLIYQKTNIVRQLTQTTPTHLSLIKNLDEMISNCVFTGPRPCPPPLEPPSRTRDHPAPKPPKISAGLADGHWSISGHLKARPLLNLSDLYFLSFFTRMSCMNLFTMAKDDRKDKG
jgi:hypothetical protein